MKYGSQTLRISDNRDAPLMEAWGHDPPSGAVIEVDRKVGDKYTLWCPCTALLLVCRPPEIRFGAGEKEIDRRAEIHYGFYFYV